MVASLPLLLTLDCVPAGSGQAELERVDPPPDLGQLDRAVREQLESLWRGLERIDGKDPEASEAWGALGRWFDVYRYPESAGRCYRNAQRLDPQEARWPYHLGVLAEEAGELGSAAGSLRRSARLAPEVAAPRVRLADLALRRQDLEEADRLYTEVLARHPDNPGALLGRGRVAMSRGDAEAAIGLLERLARSQPEAFQVNYSLALAWRKIGDEQRVAEFLRRVPEDSVDQVSLSLDALWDKELARFNVGSRRLTRLGVQAFRRGEHIRASIFLGRAVNADPEGPEERINYAVALHESGYLRAAEEQLQEALWRADPGSELAAKAHLEMGRLLVSSGRLRAAVKHFEACLASDPASAPAHFELGRLRRLQGQLEAALAHYTAPGTTDRAGVRFWHGALLTALGRHREALAVLTQASRELGDPRPLRLLMARLLSATNAAEVRDLQAAGRLVARSRRPTDVLTAETVAMVAAAQGRFGEASAWQRAAVEALSGSRLRSSLHTARRRLALYDRHEACRTPWEAREQQVLIPVEPPPPSRIPVEATVVRGEER